MKSLLHRALHKVLPDSRLAFFPARSRMRIRNGIYRLSAEREPELVHLHRLGSNQGIAIDAGANFGLYTSRLAKLYDRVLAFEPHPYLFRELCEAALPNVTVTQAALSDHPGEAILHVPVQNGRRLLGWASLQGAQTQGGESLVVKAVTIDEVAPAGIAFIKIDVEGHEVSVLHGALGSIARDHPTILCEAKGTHPGDIERLLAPFGYARSRLEDWIGIAGSPDNWLYSVRKPGDATRGNRP
jgi:FkbM family methyltransferase